MKLTLWKCRSLEAMTIEELRESRAEIETEIRRVRQAGEVAADPLGLHIGDVISYSQRLRLALSQCLRLESKLIRERAEGMCM